MSRRATLALTEGADSPALPCSAQASSQSTDQRRPLGPITRPMSSSPSVSSRPNTLSGARLAALTRPANDTTAANGVASPIVSATAAASDTPASTRIIVGDEPAKYQLHCHGWSFIRQTCVGDIQPRSPKKASTSSSQTTHDHVRIRPVAIRITASGSGSQGVNQKAFQPAAHSANQPRGAAVALVW